MYARNESEFPGSGIRALQAMSGDGIVVAEPLVTSREYPGRLQSAASKHGREAFIEQVPRRIVMQSQVRVV